MVRVSVIIPTYNRSAMVVRAVDSVLAQTFSGYELIVVDDGSTDGTRSALDAYGDSIIVLAQENTGVSAARNLGLYHAKGDLIALLDSDDAWLPEKLAVQVRFFDEHPEAMICQTEETWIRNGRRVNPKHKHKKPSGDIFLPSLELCLVSPSAVMMRKELFGLVGDFDENLPACEDYDLWLRISAGYPVHLIDQPLVVKYGGHDDQLSSTVMGLDQYRVRALQKMLEYGLQDEEKTAAVRAMIAHKAWIYGQGCLKRGKEAEGREYLALAEQYGK